MVTAEHNIMTEMVEVTIENGTEVTEFSIPRNILENYTDEIENFSEEALSFAEQRVKNSPLTKILEERA